MKKKNILAVVVFLITIATASAQTSADFTMDANGVITAYSGFDTDITIPASINGRAVTAIGDQAFQKAELTSVVIPQSVTRIGENAFEENKLTAVTIPNSITFIGNGAFSRNRLTSITIPGSVTEIGAYAFSNNTALAAIVFEEGVVTVGYDAFANTNCKSITIPSTFINSPQDVFDIRGRPSFTIAANVIPEYSSMHGNSKNLPDIIFYNYIANGRKAGTYTLDMPTVRKTADDHVYFETQYGAVLIEYEGSSSRLRVPSEIGGVVVTALSGTQIVHWQGVYNNKSIAALQIPESVTYIGSDAFSYNRLTNVTIPNSVIFIGNGAFSSNQLTSVTISNSVKTIGDAAFSSNQLTTITIPNSVTTIGDSAFYGNHLTSITIPNSVTTIGASAFYGNKLTSITIPNSVTIIGDTAFYRNQLTSLTIGNNVITIGGRAFHENKLTSVTIPNSVKTIGVDAFPDSLTSITIGANVNVIKSDYAYNTYNDFASAYINGGRRAGTYTYNAYQWTRR